MPEIKFSLSFDSNKTLSVFQHEEIAYTSLQLEIVITEQISTETN